MSLSRSLVRAVLLFRGVRSSVTNVLFFWVWFTALRFCGGRSGVLLLCVFVCSGKLQHAVIVEEKEEEIELGRLLGRASRDFVFAVVASVSQLLCIHGAV